MQNRITTKLTSRQWLALFGLLGICPWALALDPIVNDPSSPGQQALPAPPFRSQAAPEKFTLPPAPQSALGQAGRSQLILQRVDFSGNTVFSQAELQAIAKEFLQRPIYARDLEELRQRITLLYVNAGYINSGASIPSQSVANGVLQINIIEGRLTAVQQRGQGRLNDAYLRERLFLGAGNPLNIKNLQESYLLLLRDPLIERLNGRFLPGTKPGESVLDIDVVRARPYQMYLGVDDYIAPSVGSYAGRLGGMVSNLTTFGETIDAHMAIADGLIGFNTGVDLPVSAYDTHIYFRYSGNYTQLVEEPLARFKIKSHVTSYEGGISQPLYRTLANEFKMGATVSVRKDDSEFFGDPNAFLQGGAQLTVLRLWQEYHYQGIDNVLVMRSTFNQGVDAAKPNARPDFMLPDGHFFSWLGQMQYSHRILDNGARLAWKGVAQYSAEPLWNLERFAVGGVYSVRGYRENSYVRDNGFYMGLEFRYPVFGGEVGAKHSLYLIPFMDYGRAWNNPSHDIYSPTQANSLHSVGLGFNWHYQRLDVEFYWAHSLAKPEPLVVNDQAKSPLEHSIQDDGLHFRVNLNAF